VGFTGSIDTARDTVSLFYCFILSYYIDDSAHCGAIIITSTLNTWKFWWLKNM